MEAGRISVETRARGVDSRASRRAIAGSEHVWVVAIGIVSPDGRTLDALFAVVEQRDDAVHVVGAGEKPDEVHALAMRLVEGKPLAPPRGE